MRRRRARSSERATGRAQGTATLAATGQRPPVGRFEGNANKSAASDRATAILAAATAGSAADVVTASRDRTTAEGNANRSAAADRATAAAEGVAANGQTERTSTWAAAEDADVAATNGASATSAITAAEDAASATNRASAA